MKRIEPKATTGGAMHREHCLEGLRFLIEGVEGQVP